MMRFVVVFVCALLAFACPSAAQNVSRAYCGKDAKVHVVYRDGTARTLAAEPNQVGCENPTVAGDGRTVGWSVLVENCCTSYPIAISVCLYRNGKRRVISPGQMVWAWRFIDEGNRVAVLSGPVHGGATAANLYDVQSGKVRGTWFGRGTAPNWASGWEDQFTNGE